MSLIDSFGSKYPANSGNREKRDGDWLGKDSSSVLCRLLDAKSHRSRWLGKAE